MAEEISAHQKNVPGTGSGAPGFNASITRCGEAGELAQKAALRVIDIAQRAIKESGSFTIALSGGSTPRALYSLLATDRYREQIDWSVTHLFWSDERCVPPEDDESNFKMVNETLLNPEGGEPLDIPEENIHRAQAELNEAGAEVYNEEISDFFNLGNGQVPKFDLMLLGMGADGHIASIFPGSHAFDNTAALAQLIYAEHLNSWRITLTPRVITGAKRCLLLISGKAKAQILKRLFFKDNDACEIPAQMLLNEKVSTEWLVDNEAYSEIRKMER